MYNVGVREMTQAASTLGYRRLIAAVPRWCMPYGSVDIMVARRLSTGPRARAAVFAKGLAVRFSPLCRR